MRERFGTNAIIGIFLLIMLFSFAGYDAFRIVAFQVPNLNEAVPCRWLPSPEDLANNQSLIARAAVTNRAPLELRVRTNSIPQNADGELLIYILVINDTIGTVPFVYSPDEVIVGNNNTSGLGITFDPSANILLPGVNQRTDPNTYPESRIRLLGPQQRCLHIVTIPFENIPNTLRNNNVTVQAYYRGINAGEVPAANPTPIYNDQGLYTGLIQSTAVSISTAPPPAS